MVASLLSTLYFVFTIKFRLASLPASCGNKNFNLDANSNHIVLKLMDLIGSKEKHGFDKPVLSHSFPSLAIR